MNFDDAFGPLRERCTGLAQRLLGNRDAAQDVAAEALTRLLEHWTLLGADPDHATAWTLRVSRNLCIDVLRRRARESELSADLSTIERESELVLRLTVAEALQRLSPRQREVITLRYLIDLSQSDVAEILGLHPFTVAIHTSRALTRLRTLLTESRKDTPMNVTSLDQARSLMGTDHPIRTHITGQAPGGFTADIGIPALYRGRGQVRPRWAPGPPDQLIRQDVDCIIIDIGPDQRPLLTDALTEDAATEFATLQRRIAHLNIGDRYIGRVALVLSFGAFVDFEGLRGLVHESLFIPNEPPRAGAEIEIEVLDTDVQFARVSLGLST
ncbi:MAG TPA: sigma-70 family RNA polymerase sigma factor [Mycobacteriales bacterium]|nr:sigma-70 family RNA polymerase sigma factor [Mycobacteriales bacterium]